MVANQKKVNKKTILTTLSVVAIILPTLVFGKELTEIVSSVEDTMQTIAGSIVFIGWCIVGILYLTAAGSPEKIGIAKKGLVACVIGTLLVVLAAASGEIMNVIKSAFGLD